MSDRPRDARVAGSQRGAAPFRLNLEQQRKRAKELLMKNSLSMAEIAAASGFAHQSHMARHMRRMSGMAPLALKRLLTEASAN